MTEQKDEIRLKELLSVFGEDSRKEIIEILHRDQIRYHKEQLLISGVVSSLPSKEAMNKKVNTLIFENFEDDEIANRREYVFGFRACYRWIVNELKHK